MVIGADQLLETSEGLLLDKPQSVAEAKAHLELMRGTTHRLISAAVIAYAGTIIWRSVDSAQLMMRRFSDQFLDTYLTEQWPAISHCVGCYQLEGAGLQLFSKIEGSHFTILGLPLLPLCDFLRVHGVLPE